MGMEPDPPAEPIPLPRRRASVSDVGEHLHETIEAGVERLRAETKRLGELLRAAKMQQGRRQGWGPLLAVVAGGAFALGLTLGRRRRRSRILARWRG